MADLPLIARQLPSIPLLLSALLIASCGSRSTAVTPASPTAQFVVQGFVHLPKPYEKIGVPGVRVEIASGQRAGEKYATDEGGLFTLAPVTESDFDLMFSKDEFTETRYSVKGLTANRTIDVELAGQFVVSGVVHWPKPDENTIVPGARVEIASGQHTGERYGTDDRGAFKLPPIGEADVTLLFSKEDFDNERYFVNGLTGNRAVDVVMTPQRVRREWSGTISSRFDNGRYVPILTGWDSPYTFEIHRTGELSLQLETSCVVPSTAFGDLEFWVQVPSYSPDSLANLVLVSAGGLTQTSGSKLRNHYESRPKTLPPGRYLVAASHDGGPSGCLWNLLLVRPY